MLLHQLCTTKRGYQLELFDVNIVLGGAIMAKNKEKKNKKQGNNAEKHKPVNNETLNDQK